MIRRTVTWNAANYPVAITQGSHTTAFTYGPNRQRVTQTETTGGTFISATVSIGALFEQTTDSSGTIRYQHYIRAGSQTVAIHTRTSAYTAPTTTYLLRDHLGSISAITDEDGDVLTAPDGTVIGYYSYDAWGNRRNPETWQGSATNPAPDTTDRGYTGHKMLDGVNLIHMGGRVYDPALGRFFSADPIIQAPYNSQSYNRYSYVWNNPLSNTDPSGFVSQQLNSTSMTCDGNFCSVSYTPSSYDNDPFWAVVNLDFMWIRRGSSGYWSRSEVQSSLGSQMRYRMGVISRVSEYSGVNGTGSSVASEDIFVKNDQKIEISIEQLAETLLKLFERGLVGTNVLSRSGRIIDYSELSVGLVKNTITIGLRDITYYRTVSMHQPSQLGSLINWSKVDWSKYDTGGSRENVMANYLNSMN